MKNSLKKIFFLFSLLPLYNAKVHPYVAIQFNNLKIRATSIFDIIENVIVIKERHQEVSNSYVYKTIIGLLSTTNTENVIDKLICLIYGPECTLENISLLNSKGMVN